MTVPTRDMPWDVRLAAATEQVKAVHHRGGPQVDVADQLDAAIAEANAFQGRLTALLPVVNPERGWWPAERRSATVEHEAVLVACLLACRPCVHLRRGHGPQPATVELPLQRVVCRRCAQTRRNPPAGNDDRCDVCHRRGVVYFSAFAVTSGPLTFIGDACDDCAALLGVECSEQTR